MYKECSKTFHLASEERWQGYLEACRESFAELEEPARAALRYADRSGQLLDLIERGRQGEGRPDQARPKVISCPEARSPRVLPSSTPQACAGGLRPKTWEELREEHPADHASYLEAGFAPLKERTVPVSEVPSALMRGEVTKFDARELLPARMFNVTLADIAAMHPEGADEVPVWEGDGLSRTKGGARCSRWLNLFTTRFPQWGPRSLRARLARRLVVPALLRLACPFPGARALTLRDYGRLSERFHLQEVPYSNFADRRAEAQKVAKKIRAGKGPNNQIAGVSNVNMNRLPNFSFDVGGMLFPGQVESTHSLLWMGAQGGGMHADWQDNVIMQLTGEADVVVFPANCSFETFRLPNKVVVREWLSRTADKRPLPKGTARVPHFHIMLREGEGVAIPSYAFHKVVSRRSGRVAMNAFMEPKFRKMRWKESPSNYFRCASDGAEAMRVLSVKSMRRLWKTRKLHYIMHTDRNDYV